MKRFILSILGYMVVLSTNIEANTQTNVITTDKMVVIEDVLKGADTETLVIFDVDDVIIMPTEEFLFKIPLRKELRKKIAKKYSKNEQKYIFSNFFEKRNVELVDPQILEVLIDLKLRNIPTVALTGWWTGEFGRIVRMEELRFRGLNQIGLTFIDISPFKEEMCFPKFETENGVPMIKQGIILTALSDKGTILKEAIYQNNLSFKEVIFIDDDLEYLISVSKVCDELGIDFRGIHYTKANTRSVPTLDTNRESLRFEILEKEHIWLLDQDLEIRFQEY